MSEKITAIIDSDRILTISMNDGYAGEHNAQMLEIDVGPFAEGYDYYVLNFDNYRFKGKLVSNVISTDKDSPAYIVNGVIYCPLTSQLTCTGRLRVQLEAHKNTDEGEIVRKSSVAYVEFKASIMGEDDMLDGHSSLYGIIDELDKKIKLLEERPVGLTEIPIAGKNRLGCVMVDEYSEIFIGTSGRMRINYERFNGYSLAVLVVLAMLYDDSKVRCFTSFDEGTADAKLLQYSLEVLNEEAEMVLFASWNPCNVRYFDEAFNEASMKIKSNMLYRYCIEDGKAVIKTVSGEEMRKIVSEGV